MHSVLKCFQLNAHKASLKITQTLEAKSGANLHMISQQSADLYQDLPVLVCTTFQFLMHTFYEHTHRQKTIHFGEECNAACSVNFYRKQ